LANADFKTPEKKGLRRIKKDLPLLIYGLSDPKSDELRSRLSDNNRRPGDPERFRDRVAKMFTTRAGGPALRGTAAQVCHHDRRSVRCGRADPPSAIYDLGHRVDEGPRGRQIQNNHNRERLGDK
jgi:hypothetical protein